MLNRIFGTHRRVIRLHAFHLRRLIPSRTKSWPTTVKDVCRTDRRVIVIVIIAWVVFCEYTPWMDLIYIVSIWLLPVLIAITFHEAAHGAQSGDMALQRISDAAGMSLILILSDINMPGMTGLKLLPKAKAARPDVPVIMITAYGDAETRRKALESGAEALFTKPIDFGALRSQINIVRRARRLTSTASGSVGLNVRY